MKRRSYEEESQRGNETTVLRARGLRPAMPPPLKVQVTCFHMKGSMAPRQTDRQIVVPERLKKPKAENVWTDRPTEPLKEIRRE